MRFRGIDISDLVAALATRGFDYVGKSRAKGWMKFTGKLTANGTQHSCEMDIWEDLDRLPLIWLNDSPCDSARLRPHLSPSGYLCYIAHASAIVDPFDPIGQTLGALVRAEEVLDAILKGEMSEDLADEFYLHWGGKQCLVDVQNSHPGHEQAFELVGPKTSWVVVTDHPARTGIKMKTLGLELSKSRVSIARVSTQARPVPYQVDWPPRTMQALLAWQNSLDPACAAAIEKQMLGLVRQDASSIVVIVESPKMQYGFQVEIQQTSRRGKPVPFREALLRHPIRCLSVERIDDRYMSERNLPQGKTLAGLRIAMVGCGTIGGYLADMLVKAGAGTSGGQLCLIDMDTLGPQNLGRHRLGFPHLYKNKAERLAIELHYSTPGSDIKGIPFDVKGITLGKHDLLIDATGEQSLSDWLAWKHAGNTPMLTTWVEGPGHAVRALITSAPDHACPRCISRPPRSDELRVFDAPTQQLLRGHGCEGLYVPFAASASIQAAALAMEMIQAWNDGIEAPTFRTRALIMEQAQRTRDCSPAKTDGCPACST